ncbi:MAG: helix-turn-helix transcriptional regulator [Pseudonocardia sp.]|nr:helix-turn-helix transcriptional regulator [Pseudonocardia sp.]
MTSPNAGRRRQAVQNDRVILDAAREVFLADPRAPVSAVAKRAGVGFAALYRRYPAKEDLLRTLCHDGLRVFVAEASAAAAEPDPVLALTGFLERVVDADVHSLTVHLAGTFVPTVEMGVDAERASTLTGALFVRARDRLRPDAVLDDLTLLLEACAAVRVPEPDRTRVLRRRVLALMVRSLLDVEDPRALPGPPPNADEMGWRWRAG